MGQKPQPLSESPVIKSCDVSIKTPARDGEGEGRRVVRGGEEWRGEGLLVAEPVQLCTRCFQAPPFGSSPSFFSPPARPLEREDSSARSAASNNVRHANTSSAVICTLFRRQARTVICDT